MTARIKSILNVILWVGPLLLGILIASIVAPLSRDRPRPPREERRHADDDHGRRDRALRQGAWEGVAVERDGRMVYQGDEARVTRVSFSADRVTFEEGDASVHGTFRLNSAVDPKIVDLLVEDGAIETSYPADIYRLDHDSFELCFAFPSADRPSNFATFPGSGRTLFVYRRARSAKSLGEKPVAMP